MASTTLLKIFTAAYLVLHIFSWFNNIEALSEGAAQDIMECKDEYNVSDSEMDQLRSTEIPDTRAAQCFLACVMGRLDMMDGGELNSAGAKGMVSQMEGVDDDDKGKLIASIDECEKILTYSGEDECENAVKISMCISDKALEKGVKKPE